MSNKKAQAAMEFIMTYGWAILAVTVVVAALVYFGVFSPAKLLPEQCQFPPELACVGKPLVEDATDLITVSLANNIGNAMNLTDVINGTNDCIVADIRSIDGTAMVDGALSGVIIQNNDQVTVIFNCSGMVAGRFKSDITLRYINLQNGINYPITGSIQANAK